MFLLALMILTPIVFACIRTNDFANCTTVAAGTSANCNNLVIDTPTLEYYTCLCDAGNANLKCYELCPDDKQLQLQLTNIKQAASASCQGVSVLKNQGFTTSSSAAPITTSSDSTVTTISTASSMATTINSVFTSTSQGTVATVSDSGSTTATKPRPSRPKATTSGVLFATGGDVPDNSAENGSNLVPLPRVPLQPVSEGSGRDFALFNILLYGLVPTLSSASRAYFQGRSIRFASAGVATAKTTPHQPPQPGKKGYAKPPLPIPPKDTKKASSNMFLESIQNLNPYQKLYFALGWLVFAACGTYMTYQLEEIMPVPKRPEIQSGGEVVAAKSPLDLILQEETAKELEELAKNSKFKETGVLTPEEFVLAGDFLVYKCPTWAWAAGLPAKRKDFLPPDKQYLITRNVPCLKRVAAMEYRDADEDEAVDDEMGDDAWVATHKGRVVGEGSGPNQEVGEIDDEQVEAVEPVAVVEEQKKSSEALPNIDDLNLDDIPDMDEELELVEMEEEEDPAAMATGGDDGDKFVKTRTYDMSITYDKYYQTPRVFLFGYDENRKPLTPQQIFQDISQDHAKKTVTIESHPHESLQLASIHPCKHGNVMIRLIEQMVESGKEELRVDQYLLLFLKFMSSVLPTMEYDYTGDGF
ncbi:E2-like enzyme [Rhizoclosmatium sp. JEL0117]|nr:E2-like enzyme [Rhizoclosmatium sp. JEL0117]